MPRVALFSLLIFSLVHTACFRSGDTEEAKACKATADKFFGLCEYMSSIIIEYSEEDFKVNKKVTLNDNSEQLNDLSINWETELKPLAAAYINRPAWLDKFTVDTTRSSNGYSVTYRSVSSNIPVKELSIRFLTSESSPEVVDEITVETGRKNLLYTSREVIRFEPGRRYQVEGRQRTLFLSKTTFSVDSEIINNTSRQSPEE